MSPTQWTWLTLWIGCGGNTRTRRSLRWSPCPGWWLGWPLMSFLSGDIMDEEEELRNSSEQKPACLKAKLHLFTTRLLPSQQSQWLVSSRYLKPTLAILWHWKIQGFSDKTYISKNPPAFEHDSQSKQLVCMHSEGPEFNSFCWRSYIQWQALKIHFHKCLFPVNKNASAGAYNNHDLAEWAPPFITKDSSKCKCYRLCSVYYERGRDIQMDWQISL